MTFWGGHYTQSALSQAVPGCNPLGLGLLADMIELVDRVQGLLVGIPTQMGVQHPDVPVLYAAYGRAEMLYIQAEIHNDIYLKY